jgi:mannosyl-3-phosphoglycerate phosphatase family protein
MLEAAIDTEALEEMVLGERRENILNTIKLIAPSYPFQFIQYSQSSIIDIARMTGLAKNEAKQSSNRYYTEPVIWQGEASQKLAFIKAVEQSGLHTLQGGRFLHVMGKTDKGQAIKKLALRYKKHYSTPVTTIALGDSPNDIAMLQAADIAIVIRSPHYAPPEFEHPHKIISHAYGPAGWNECIQKIIFNAATNH